MINLLAIYNFFGNSRDKKEAPLVPAVREELLFQTGAPEFVVKKGES